MQNFGCISHLFYIDRLMKMSNFFLYICDICMQKVSNYVKLSGLEPHEQSCKSLHFLYSHTSVMILLFYHHCQLIQYTCTQPVLLGGYGHCHTQTLERITSLIAQQEHMIMVNCHGEKQQKTIVYLSSFWSKLYYMDYFSYSVKKCLL